MMNFCLIFILKDFEHPRVLEADLQVAVRPGDQTPNDANPAVVIKRSQKQGGESETSAEK